jgi:hypothetical protein
MIDICFIIKYRFFYNNLFLRLLQIIQNFHKKSARPFNASEPELAFNNW